MNLLSNAIKFSPEDGNISIETEATDAGLLLTVADSGIGIPQADQEHLFERFFRAHNVTNIQGTGLGLVGMQERVSVLGGTLRHGASGAGVFEVDATLPVGP